MKKILALAFATLSLGGCVSSLDVHRFQPAAAQVGYPYRLRLTQYQVTLTWRVTACNAADGPKALKFKMSADKTDATALDTEQFYVIDPRSLQGLFRTTEFTMEWYEDRTPKSITSDVDDQSADAIGNVLQGVAKLAATGLIPAGKGPGACTIEVTNALDAINGKGKTPGQQAVTSAAQKAVDDQTALVTKLNAAATAMGATIDDATRRTLGQARARLEALTGTLNLEQAKLKTLNDVLTDTQTFTWPDVGSDFTGDPAGYAPSSGAAKRWGLDTSDTSIKMFLRLTPLDDLRLAADTPKQISSPTKPPKVDGAPDLGEAAPPPAVTPVVVRQTGTATHPEKIPGLPYREPGRVQLDICSAAPCDQNDKALAAAGRLIATSKGLALQAATMMYLPFRAQTFAHIKNSAGFAQSGVLTSAGTSQLRGAGTGVTQAIKNAGDQVGGIVDGIRGAATKRLTAATDEAKARKALSDAQAALSPAPNADELAQIAALQTEATLATTQKSVYDAQVALAASKAAAGQ